VVAALDLFAAQGYENTTVIEIAKRAGVTKSTFFRHFLGQAAGAVRSRRGGGAARSRDSRRPARVDGARGL